MEQQVKQVPYGVADFATVIEQNLYYVDKTMFIPELEKQPRNLFFIRPRRFGKSIFLSMLYSYYDCTQSHKFQSLFGNLWIGQHPTPLQGKYQVLFLDFSQITGNIDKLETKFNSYLSINSMLLSVNTQNIIRQRWKKSWRRKISRKRWN